MNEPVSVTLKPNFATAPLESGNSVRRSFARGHLLPLTILVLSVCLFRWPLISGLYSFLDVGPDSPDMTVPDLEFRAHALRQGVVPLWSNYHHGGQALIGELLPGVLNPFSYALLAVPLKNGHINPSAFLDYFVLLECFAAIAAYFLLWDLKCAPWAAVLGALFYTIGGPPGNSVWVEFVVGVIYPPLVLLFLFRSLRGQRPLANCAVAGAICGLTWYGGSHHFGLITSITCFAILLVFSIRREWKPGLVRAAIFAIVLFCVSAPQVLPAVEFSKLSVRWVGVPGDPFPGAKKVPYLAHLNEYLHPSNLLDIPFALQTGYWGAGMAFAGIVALSFIPFAIRSLSTTRFLRLLAACAIAGILLSMSAWNILYGVAYLLIPAFDKLREGLIWIFLAHIVWTCLFGIGLTRFLNGADLDIQRVLKRVLWIASPCLLTLAALINLFGKPELREAADRLAISGMVAFFIGGILLLSERGLAKPAVCCLLLGAALMIEHGNVSGSMSLRFLPRTDEMSKRFTGPVAANDELARFLKTRPDVIRMDADPNDVPENFGEIHDVEELSGHGAAMLTTLYELPYWSAKARQLYGMNYFIGRKPANSGQQLVYTAASGINVYFSPGARPRVWAVHSAVPVTNWQEARTLFESAAFDPAQMTYIQRKETPPELASCPASPDQVALVERTQIYVKIQATLGCKGMVILNDNFYPGWQAYVDGKRTPLFSAYMCIRGVVVDAGQHTVEMRYVPWSLYQGILLGLIGIAGTVFLWRRNEPAAEDLLA